MAGTEQILVVLGGVGLAALAAYLAAPLAFLIPARARRLGFLRRPFAFLSGLRILPNEDLIHQSGTENCGAACVEYVLERLGIGRDEGVLDQLQQRPGTSMVDLNRALVDHGVAARGMQWSSVGRFRSELARGRLAILTVEPGYIFKGRRNLYLPLFVFWHWLARRYPQLRHWILVSVEDEDNIVISDPYVGRLLYATPDLGLVWSQKTLIIQP